MIAAYGTAERAVGSLARHTSLLILGTITATAILAGVRAEWPRRAASPPVRAASELTSGGKFAARAGNGDPDPFVTLMVLPSILPMFTAPTVPVLRPAPPAAASFDKITDISRAPRLATVARHDGRHPVAVAEHPPRWARAPMIAMGPLPDLPVAAPAQPTLWARSKVAYENVVAWSAGLGDRLLP